MENREQDSLETAALSIAHNILREDESEEGIIYVIRQLSAFADHIVDTLVSNDPGLAADCCVKCSYCCHMQVKVTPPEAFSMVQYIHENFSKKAQAILRDRIKRNRELTEGKTLGQRVKQKDQTPCIFLSHHACDIYPVRPLVCRAWHSLDKNGCKKAFLSLDPGAEIKTTPDRNYIYSMMERALKTICSHRKLTYGRYELPIIMDRCMNSGDVLNTWWFNPSPLFVDD